MGDFYVSPKIFNEANKYVKAGRTFGLDGNLLDTYIRMAEYLDYITSVENELKVAPKSLNKVKNVVEDITETLKNHKWEDLPKQLDAYFEIKPVLDQEVKAIFDQEDKAILDQEDKAIGDGDELLDLTDRMNVNSLSIKIDDATIKTKLAYTKNEANSILRLDNLKKQWDPNDRVKKTDLRADWEKYNFKKDKLVPETKNLTANLYWLTTNQFAKNVVTLVKAYKQNPDDERLRDIKKHAGDGFDEVKNLSDDEIKQEVFRVMSQKEPKWKNKFWNSVGEYTSTLYAEIPNIPPEDKERTSFYSDLLSNANYISNTYVDLKMENGQVAAYAFVKENGVDVLNPDQRDMLLEKLDSIGKTFNEEKDPPVLYDPFVNDVRLTMQFPHEVFKKIQEMNQLSHEKVAELLHDYELRKANPGVLKKRPDSLNDQQYEAYMNFLRYPNGIGEPLAKYQQVRFENVTKALEEVRKKPEFKNYKQQQSRVIKVADLSNLESRMILLGNLLPEEAPLKDELAALAQGIHDMNIQAMEVEDLIKEVKLPLGEKDANAETKVVYLEDLDKVCGQVYPEKRLPSQILWDLNLVCDQLLPEMTVEETPLKHTVLQSMKAIAQTTLSGGNSVELDVGLGASGKMAIDKLNDINGPTEDQLKNLSARQREEVINQIETSVKNNDAINRILAGCKQKQILVDYVNAKNAAIETGKKFNDRKYREALLENVRALIPDETGEAERSALLLETEEPLEQLNYLVHSSEIAKNVISNEEPNYWKQLEDAKLRETTPLLKNFMEDMELLSMTTSKEGMEKLINMAKDYGTTYSSLLRVTAERIGEFDAAFKGGQLGMELSEAESMAISQILADVDSLKAYTTNPSFGNAYLGDLDRAKVALEETKHYMFEKRFLELTDNMFTTEEYQQMVNSSTGNKNSTVYQNMMDAYKVVYEHRQAILKGELNRISPEELRASIQTLNETSNAYTKARSGLFSANSKVGEARLKQSKRMGQNTSNALEELDKEISKLTVQERVMGISNEALVAISGAKQLDKIPVTSNIDAKDLNKDKIALEDSFYMLRKLYGTKAEQFADMPGAEDYNKIELPIPNGKDEDFVMAVAIGACMDPIRLRDKVLTSSSTGDKGKDGVLNLNQVFFIDNLVSGTDKRSGNFGPIMVEARKEAKIALEEYANGKPEKAEKMFANFMNHIKTGALEYSFHALSGTLSHPTVAANQLAIKFMEDSTINKNVKLTDVEQIRLRNYQIIYQIEQNVSKTLSDAFLDPTKLSAPGSEERAQLAERIIFDMMVKNALQPEGLKATEKIQEKTILDRMKDKYDLEYKQTESRRSLPEVYFEDTEQMKYHNDKLQKSIEKYRINDMEIQLSNENRIEEMRKLYSDAIKKSPLYGKMLMGSGRDFKDACMKAAFTKFEDFKDVKPDLSQAKDIADTINNQYKPQLDMSIEEANILFRERADMALDKVFAEFTEPKKSFSKKISTPDTKGLQVMAENLDRMYEYLKNPDAPGEVKEKYEYYKYPATVDDAITRLKEASDYVKMTIENNMVITKEIQEVISSKLKSAETGLQVAYSSNAFDAEPNKLKYAQGLQGVQYGVVANRCMLENAFEAYSKHSEFGAKMNNAFAELGTEITNKIREYSTRLEEIEKQPEKKNVEEEREVAARLLTYIAYRQQYQKMELSVENYESMKDLIQEDRVAEEVTKIKDTKAFEKAMNHQGLDSMSLLEHYGEAVEEQKAEDARLAKEMEKAAQKEKVEGEPQKANVKKAPQVNVPK